MIFNQTTKKEWHVVYTRSRAEKKVNSELQALGIESYLPLQKKLHRWKDRKKWVEVPLISGYCFVNISRKEYDKVLQTGNVVCYVTFEGRAAVIPEDQISALKTMLKEFDFDVTVSFDNFHPGQKVEIVQGPLVGLKGELIQNRGKHKFLLRIEQINAQIIFETQAENISAIRTEILH